MPYLILGVGLLLGLYFLLRWFVAANPQDVRKALLWTAVVLGVLISGFLLVTGRASIAGILIFAAFPLLWSFFQARRALRGQRPPRPGRASQVQTRWLDMALDHDSGALDGQVREGRFQGARLSELSLAQLAELYQEVAGDPQSQQIIQAYLDREHGPDWRARAGAGQGEGANGSNARSGPMTVAEACEILGVGPKAKPDEIEAAYRAAMKRAHPDAGGSTEQAARINEARALLLG